MTIRRLNAIFSLFAGVSMSVFSCYIMASQATEATSDVTYTIKDNLLVTTIGDYRKGLARFCIRIKPEMRNRIYHETQIKANPLSDLEVTQLIGDKHDGFAVEDLQTFVSRATKIMLTTEEMFGKNAAQLIHQNEFDDYPLICGAPEHLKRAASEGKAVTMKIKNLIDSPNDWYMVLGDHITHISVADKTEGNNFYNVNFHLVKTSISEFEPGELAIKGRWYPGFQQFHVQHYRKLKKSSHCDGWDYKKWSYKFGPTILDIAGNKVQAFKEFSYYGRGRKPTGVCENVRIIQETCEVTRCLTATQPKPAAFLVESKQDALTLYRSLSEQ